MNIPQIRMPDQIDIRSMGVGLGIVLLLYMLALFYAFYSSNSTYEEMELRLASHRILLISPEETQTSVLSGKTTGKSEDPDPEGALVKSPLSGLAEKTEYGLLPIIRAHDQMTSFQAYKRPISLPLPKDKTPIAILIADFGLSPKTAKKSLEALPPEISFLLSPYSQSPETWKELARRKGHESWMHIPLENGNIRNNDPGPAAILLREPLETSKQKLYWSMAKTTGYVGLAAFNDDSFEMAQKSLKATFKEGLERGVAYLELNPESEAHLQGTALGAGMHYIQADSWIHRNEGKNSFSDFEKMAKEKGYALAVLPPWPQSLKMLENWIKTLDQKQFTLIPVSAIAEIQGEGLLTPHKLETPDRVEPEPPAPDHTNNYNAQQADL